MKNILIVFALLASQAVLPAVSQAALSTIRFQNGPGNSAGEFKVDLSSDGGATWNNDVFRTFCVERNEFIGYGVKYSVHSVQDRAVLGGRGGQDSIDATVEIPAGSPYNGTYNADTISAETAWLFLEFTNGTLAGYDYGGIGRATSADMLQHAIWRLEDEGANVGLSTTYYDLATNADAAAKAAALTRVLAINPVVFGSDGSLQVHHKQSMLFVIPEPTTILVWSALSLIGVARFRRRSSTRA